MQIQLYFCGDSCNGNSKHLKNLLDTLDIAIWELDTEYQVQNQTWKVREIYDNIATRKEALNVRKFESDSALTITHSIINQHNGSINIETETAAGSNPGSPCTILLPATDQEVTTTAGDPETDQVKPENITILIMDDEPMISDLLEKILQTKGFNTLTAADGRDALNLYKDNTAAGTRISLAIMDLTVPGGMGGMEAAEKLLEIDPQAKIIVSSGYADDPIMAKFKEYGFKAALSKPFRIQELFSTVEEVLTS